MPGDYGVSATFNVANLQAYHDDDYLADLRIKSSQHGEDDGVPTTMDKEEGPTTHSRSISSSKLQALLQNVQDVQGSSHGPAYLKIPGFVNVIT